MPQFLRAVRVCAGVSALSFVLAASASAATIDVPAGGDLQGAMNAALPGDVIQLESGATYVGNFRLPVKDGALDFITIRTLAAARDLPSPGYRVTPTQFKVLAKVKSPNGSPALVTEQGAHHWRIEMVEFLANEGGVGDIIVLGASASQTLVAQMPHDLVFDRVYIHGDPLVGQKRGIALNSASTQIVNSYIADIKSIGQDSQAIAGWNGSGPFLIENNYLEGAGENVLFGGADPSVPNLVPSDITIRRNLFTKPAKWRTEKWQVKNAFELKNARRVLVEGNVFENVWGAAQDGFAVLFTTRNQDGKAPWSVVEDVTFRYNVIRHAGSGFNITGYDDLKPSQQGRRFRISHNLLYDIDGAAWNGVGIFMQIGNEPRDITVEHNTVVHTGVVVSVYGTRNGAPTPINGFVFRDNLMRHNKYGVKGAALNSGIPTLSVYFTNLTFDRNVLAGGDPLIYPVGNYFPSVAEFDGSFVDTARENYTLIPGSPYRDLASDGTALGADINGVSAAQAGVQVVPTSPETPASAKPGTRTDTGRVAACKPGRTCASEPVLSRKP